MNSKMCQLDHVDNLGDVLDRLLGLGELSEEVFGDPSPQLREILAPLNLKIYTRLQGLYHDALIRRRLLQRPQSTMLSE